MQAVKRLLEKYPKLHYAPLAAILAIAGYFYFQNLGTHYITLWDEAVHVNVVKNLATHCCIPKLHLTDIGIDFQDWTSNYIWVHKPLMPLFLQAVFFKLGGGTLFAFRLPGALAALSIIAVLFWVGRIILVLRWALFPPRCLLLTRMCLNW
jgi:4-amino-4-deoxy-L-arabinose transferase-like glycosyltransferase